MIDGERVFGAREVALRCLGISGFFGIKASRGVGESRCGGSREVSRVGAEVPCWGLSRCQSLLGVILARSRALLDAQGVVLIYWISGPWASQFLLYCGGVIGYVDPWAHG